MATRINYFDIAKGLAMFCVIAGHGGVSQVNAFVFSFHMPLFFLIYGYFFKPDRAKVWRNTKKLLLAYCWTVAAVIVLSELITLTEVLTKGEDAFVLIKNPLKWIIAGLYGSGSRTDFLGLVLPSIGAVWFFLALAIGGGMLFIISKLRRGYQQTIACILLFLTGWLSARLTWLPLSVQAGMCATLFMFVGYRASMYKALEKPKLFIPVSIAVWVIALHFSYTNDFMSIVKSSYPNPLINISGGICGTYLVVCLSRWLEKIQCEKLRDFLIFWGRNTLIVLCAHLTELNCLPWDRVKTLIDCFPISIIVVFSLKVLWALLAILLVNEIRRLRHKSLPA